MDLVGLIDLNGHNGHIVLVPVAIAVLVWVRRRRIAYIRVGTRLLGPVIALVGIICLLSGGSAGVSYLYHAGAVLVALGAFVSVSGKGIILRLLPVMAALLLLLPVPGRVRETVAPPLREHTLSVSTGILRAMRLVQVERIDHNMVAVSAMADGDRDVVATAVPISRLRAACEGMPTTMVLFVVIYTYAFARPLRNRYRWLLLILCIPLGLIANVIRATPLVWLLAQTSAGSSSAASTELAVRVGTYSEWLAVPLGLLAAAGMVRLLCWSGLHVNTYRLAR